MSRLARQMKRREQAEQRGSQRGSVATRLHRVLARFDVHPDVYFYDYMFAKRISRREEPHERARSDFYDALKSANLNVDRVTRVWPPDSFKRKDGLPEPYDFEPS